MAFTAKRASLRMPGGSASQCLICFRRSMVLHCQQLSHHLHCVSFWAQTESFKDTAPNAWHKRQSVASVSFIMYTASCECPLPVEQACNVSIVQIAVLGHLVPGAATCPGLHHTCQAGTPGSLPFSQHCLPWIRFDIMLHTPVCALEESVLQEPISPSL